MVHFLKLTTGEEVIADTEIGDGVYKLKTPIKIGIAREGLAMMPFSPFLKDETITIRQEHVLFIGEPDDEIRNAYNSKFGSGIVLPPPGLSIVEP